MTEQKRKGITLTEIMLAVAILGFIILPIFGLYGITPTVLPANRTPKASPPTSQKKK